MSRRPRIPRELASRPFTLEEARAAGLTLSCLKGRAWRRIGYELYCRRSLAEDPLQLLSAWRRLLGDTAVFAGSSAAWLHGLDITPSQPVEVIVPVGSAVRSRSGLIVHRADIHAAEIVSVRGLPATGIHRALWHLARRLTAVEALVAIDMAVAKAVTDKETLRRYAHGLGRSGGAARLRTLVDLAEPAESPMETRLRWLLNRSGLPGPDVQRELRDEDGRFLGRADLYFPASSVIVEYDGDNHRERLVEDDRRQNRLINAGFHILRFTGRDVLQRPDVVVAQVKAALSVPNRSARVAPETRMGERPTASLASDVRFGAA